MTRRTADDTADGAATIGASIGEGEAAVSAALGALDVGALPDRDAVLALLRLAAAREAARAAATAGYDPAKLGALAKVAAELWPTDGAATADPTAGALAALEAAARDADAARRVLGET